MDQAIADVKNAQARFESAAAGLAQAEEQLEYTQIRAPYSGIVTHRHVEIGEIASPGQPVMSGISLKTRFRHYLNLDRMASRLERLSRDFAWAPMRDVFGVR